VTVSRRKLFTGGALSKERATSGRWSVGGGGGGGGGVECLGQPPHMDRHVRPPIQAWVGGGERSKTDRRGGETRIKDWLRKTVRLRAIEMYLSIHHSPLRDGAFEYTIKIWEKEGLAEKGKSNAGWGDFEPMGRASAQKSRVTLVPARRGETDASRKGELRRQRPAEGK